MGDVTRGITCPDMRRVIREALANGWEWAGVDSKTHGVIEWPANGVVVRFGMTPSLASWKSVATEVKRISGVEVWRKGNRKRSHKADDLSGFSIETAIREQATFHRHHDKTPEELEVRRLDLIGECFRVAADPHRFDVQHLPDKWAEIAELEDKLGIETGRFDPASLAMAAPRLKSKTRLRPDPPVLATPVVIKREGRKVRGERKIVKWADPPPVRGPGGNGARGNPWAGIVESLKERPGEWAVVVEDGWTSISSAINRAAIKAFEPAGAFEATTRVTGSNSRGKAVIYARYIGEAATAPTPTQVFRKAV